MDAKRDAPACAVDPDTGDPLYAYKPSLIGAPHEFRLRPAGLDWRVGRRGDIARYDRIRRVRLAFRPVTMQTYRFVTEIWPEAGPRLQIASSSWRSIAEQQRLDGAYRAFVCELHRRMAAAGSTAAFVAGSPPLLYWPGLIAFVAVSFALAALVVKALALGALAAAGLIAVIFAVFLWQAGTFFRRNRPGTYRPDALPPNLLPRA